MNHSQLAQMPYVSLRYRDARTIVSSGGYVLEHCRYHPSCNQYGLVPEHRLVMEDHIGRFLTGQEVVHHVDFDTRNNRIENLLLFPNQTMHMRLHQQLKATCYDPKAIRRVRKAAPDPNIGLKDLGMHPDTAAKICRLNDIEWVNPCLTSLTREKVTEALQGRTTDEAAEYLGVGRSTLYRNWNHLLDKRHEPVALDDPDIVQLVRDAAADPEVTYRDLAEIGVSSQVAKRICDQCGLSWFYYHRGSRILKHTTPKNRKRS